MVVKSTSVTSGYTSQFYTTTLTFIPPVHLPIPAIKVLQENERRWKVECGVWLREYAVTKTIAIPKHNSCIIYCKNL